jgi:GDP-L-fucose synthase
MHRAKTRGEPSVVIWGTGAPRRETLYVDDLADACIYLMDNYSGSEMVNVGSGNDISIEEMALTIKEVVGYDGEIIYNVSKPDGIPRKLLDNCRIAGLGWQPKTDFDEGLRRTYRWYLEHAGALESVV